MTLEGTNSQEAEWLPQIQVCQWQMLWTRVLNRNAAGCREQVSVTVLRGKKVCVYFKVCPKYALNNVRVGGELPRAQRENNVSDRRVHVWTAGTPDTVTDIMPTDQLSNRACTTPAVMATAPYFFSSSHARNPHLHRSQGLVALRTRKLRVCPYAACGDKGAHIEHGRID